MIRPVKLFIATSVLGLMSLAAYIFYFDQTVFVFRDIQVTVVGEHWREEMLRQTQTKWLVRFLTHKNKNLWQVPIEEISDSILRDPSVQSVVVERVWPHRVQVRMQLKPVVLVYFEGKKRVRAVTADGAMLPPMDLVYAPDVPFVRNSVFAKDEDARKKMLQLYLLVPNEGVISKSEVAEVDWNEAHGLLLQMSRGVEGEIVLGHGDVRLKAKRVANVLKYLESQNQKWRVIDASFAKKVLVRLRKHS